MYEVLSSRLEHINTVNGNSRFRSYYEYYMELAGLFQLFKKYSCGIDFHIIME